MIVANVQTFIISAFTHTLIFSTNTKHWLFLQMSRLIIAANIQSFIILKISGNWSLLEKLSINANTTNIHYYHKYPEIRNLVLLQIHKANIATDLPPTTKTAIKTVYIILY